MAMLEADMEKQLIDQLCFGDSQWTYRPDIKTDADLWANLRTKLNNNNIAALDGVPLTDSEMEQVKDFIREQAETTYKAARWLAGEHSIAQIPVIREDASKGTVYLMAINNREINGGRSSYEVINQLQSNINEVGGDRNRRFDVTLLINGLPMIQIELKNQDHPFMDAFRQIKKYGEEGKFRGLMGLVQMYVVTNGVETRYMAADNRGNLNEKFMIRWVDEHNEPVEDFIAFAKAALKIPDAHNMVGKYAVLDNDRKIVILLRPYQIHAIEACRKASFQRQSGFIWHTTGSGKTLTSYTVTKNLLDIPSVDKTIFLIDRKDLDQQTSTSFMSYADSDDIDVANTESTHELEKKLKSKDRLAIVTTIQKLQTIIRRCTEASTADKFKTLAESISKKNIAFVVDECHRAVTPETKRTIEKFFFKSLWFGFTGTPIFAENKRARKGDLARTTEDLYGACLHRYTIKEAIADKAVLGFHIQSMGHSIESFQDMAVQLNLYDEVGVTEVEPAELETQVVSAYNRTQENDFYDSDEHRYRVIDYIANRCAAKLKLNAPVGEAYEGLLTVPSIQIAQCYYELFQEFKKDGKVSESIKKLLPDFPKVAITYTVGENQDGADVDQQKMKVSLDDYNSMFGTNWDLSTLPAYNADLNDRLARKRSRFKDRGEQLDIVIVVDRLLTGFDAPPLAAIFLDRPPMKPQHLIQAFSRTNRLYDKSKRYGQVITMQTPWLYEKCINDALVLYSNGGKSDVAAPSWEQTKERAIKAVEDLRGIARMPVDYMKLHERSELLAFVKAFQQVDRYLGEAQVYDEFDESQFSQTFGITREELVAYTGHYHNALEKLKEKWPENNDDDPISIDIEYELETVKQVEVNYRYLVALLQAHMDADSKPITEDDNARILKYIDEYKRTNPRVGEILESLWIEMKLAPQNFFGKDAQNIIEFRIDEVVSRLIGKFAQEWSVNEAELRAYALTTPKSELVPEKVNTGMGDFKAYRAAGGSGSKLNYLQGLREAVVKFVSGEIKPLLKL